MSFPNEVDLNANLASEYQSKTDKEHVLFRPNTYIGSITNTVDNMWVYDDATNKIVLKQIQFVPALYKLFDECIVNSRDHIVRMQELKNADNAHNKQVTYIKVDITPDGSICIENDGNGVAVAMHPEHKMWIPQMVFANLRSSTNYNDNENRTTGGTNGFGVKLVFIWSTYGQIETVDHLRGLKYVQTYRNNLDVIEAPIVTKIPKTTKPYTKVIFKPDYARLKVDGINADLLSLIKKRVYDIAAISDKKVKVYFNSTQIQINNFQQYIDLYIGGKSEENGCRIYDNPSERWEFALCVSPIDTYTQMSFVNGIATYKGGKHVDYILNQVVSKVIDIIERKKKIKVSFSSIKEQLMVFLRCDINKPEFKSQVKEEMTTSISEFGSTCIISDEFAEKVVSKLNVMETACSITELKTLKTAKRQTDGVKVKTIFIAGLVDAISAGTSKSKDCTLILCEGDSAKGGIISGLTSADREYIGIYPLKGKVRNVRDVEISNIIKNEEISDIIKILGLSLGESYPTMLDVHARLRYSKVVVMTDQDKDGSHIKGLIINLFHYLFPSLTKLEGFISFMNTPIYRATKNSSELLFYNDGDYTKWQESITPKEFNSWTIKYFKGLGTSQASDFKKYFQNRRFIEFQYTNTTDNVIDMIFKKKRANERKDWLAEYNRQSYLDTNEKKVTYDDFFHKEMRHFSIYDCERSLPHFMDGLKTSLRKILFCAFKRNLTSEIKVAQMIGYVSEHSSYHHGETSLVGGIVTMAQNFVGTNNINVLMPNGNFGDRNLGPKSHASERYIFTMLTPITRYIYRKEDDPILNYLSDDGQSIEPEYYIPIVPMILVNGSSGIGTGYSCETNCYQLTEIMKYLNVRLRLPRGSQMDNSMFKWVPYYEGFKGDIITLDEGARYLFKGKYRVVNRDQIVIYELPVGTWTEPFVNNIKQVLLDELNAEAEYKKSLKKVDTKTPAATPSKKRKTPEKAESQPAQPERYIKDIRDRSTDTDVIVEIDFYPGAIEKLTSQTSEPHINGLEKLLNLYSKQSNSNIHMFDENFCIHKYNNISEILDAYYPIRLMAYQKRKQYMVSQYEAQLLRCNNKARFITLILNDEIDLRRKKSQEVTQMLRGLQFDQIDDSYEYLTGMKMDSVTTEKVDSILKEKHDCELLLKTLVGTSLEQLWINDLEELQVQYDLYIRNRYQYLVDASNVATKTAKPAIKKVVVSKK